MKTLPRRFPKLLSAFGLMGSGFVRVAGSKVSSFWFGFVAQPSGNSSKVFFKKAWGPLLKWQGKALIGNSTHVRVCTSLASVEERLLLQLVLLICRVATVTVTKSGYWESAEAQIFPYTGICLCRMNSYVVQ